MNLKRRTLVVALGLAPVETPGKIEVVEFFWYGCPHCYSLEPLLEKWVARLPKDVQFRRIPAVFNDNWARDAAVFYSFEALGVLERLHRPYFDAIHRDGLNTRDRAAFDGWLKKQGVDVKRFEAAYQSFGVQSKVRRAMQLSVAYGIDGTPAMAVQGRYRISAEQGQTHEGMLAIADYLISLERKARSG